MCSKLLIISTGITDFAKHAITDRVLKLSDSIREIVMNTINTESVMKEILTLQGPF